MFQRLAVTSNRTLTLNVKAASWTKYVARSQLQQLAFSTRSLMMVQLMLDAVCAFFWQVCGEVCVSPLLTLAAVTYIVYGSRYFRSTTTTRETGTMTEWETLPPAARSPPSSGRVQWSAKFRGCSADYNDSFEQQHTVSVSQQGTRWHLDRQCFHLKRASNVRVLPPCMDCAVSGK